MFDLRAAESLGTEPIQCTACANHQQQISVDRVWRWPREDVSVNVD
jgi:hypothetical protein